MGPRTRTKDEDEYDWRHFAPADPFRTASSLILGPLFAHSVRAVADEARPNGVNVISFSNDVSVAGGGVYVMGLAPRSQIQRVVGYASFAVHDDAR